jgi:hypothetical protein
MAADFFPPKANRADGDRLEMHSDLRVSITGPTTSEYDPSIFGPSRRTVSVRLTNEGDHPVDMSGVDALFSVTRDSVTFPCARRGHRSAQTRAAFNLPPGESFTFERDVDCLMPIAGRYAIGVFIGFDEPSGRTTPDFADEFTLEILPSPRAPRPYPSRAGLYVVLGGDTVTRPLPAASWARGDYHVVVAVINASADSIAVGPARLAFLTYKGSSSLPCSGQDEALTFPATLEPGSMVTVPAPVACAPSTEGIYEIVGKLGFANDEPKLEIGRVDLTVTTRPLFFNPGLKVWPSERAL